MKADSAEVVQMQAARIEFTRVRATFPRARWAEFNDRVKQLCHESCDGEPVRARDWVWGVRVAALTMNGKLSLQETPED